jgi:probable HAF family extracellular repeat protein
LTVFGFAEGPAAGTEAWRWTIEGGVEWLGTGEGSSSRVFSSTTDGTMLTGQTVLGDAAVWSTASQWIELDQPDGASSAAAFGISGDGSVIVGETLFNIDGVFHHEPTVWLDDQAPFTLDVFPRLEDEDSAAHDVSADGQVVVGYANNADGVREAFRWTSEDGAVGLGVGDTPGFFESVARATNSNGDVVVGFLNQGLAQHGFRWTADDGLVDLGVIPQKGTSTRALDVNGDGSVVVGWTGGAFVRPFIWDETNGMRDLGALIDELSGRDELPGWTRMAATGVSDDGRTIVGWGLNPSVAREGWLIRLPDPPPCAADFDGSGDVGLDDLMAIITAWGNRGATDLDGSGATGVLDLVLLLGAWGACQ